VAKVDKGENLGVFPDTYDSGAQRPETAAHSSKGRRFQGGNFRGSPVSSLIAAMTVAASIPFFIKDFPLPLVTLAILYVTVVSSVSVLKGRLDAERLLLDSDAVQRGEKSRLVSTTLVHGDALHLLFNCFALWSFGTGVERVMINRFGVLGGVMFALFYLFAAVASSYLNVLVAKFRRVQHLSVGASGAVLVLVAFFTVLYPTSTFLLLFIPMPAWLFLVAFTGISLYAARKGNSRVDSVMTFGRGRVDHVGHLSGIVIGVTSAFLFI
jgi:membrane associated rhomboid family serine protease